MKMSKSLRVFESSIIRSEKLFNLISQVKHTHNIKRILHSFFWTSKGHHLWSVVRNMEQHPKNRPPHICKQIHQTFSLSDCLLQHLWGVDATTRSKGHVALHSHALQLHHLLPDLPVQPGHQVIQQQLWTTKHSSSPQQGILFTRESRGE